MSQTERALPQDRRNWTQLLGTLGPLTYLPQGSPAVDSAEGEMGTFAHLDSEVAFVTIGVRVSRELAIMTALLFGAFIPVFAWLGIDSYHDHSEIGTAFGLAATVLLAAFCYTLIRTDLFRVAEGLVLLNRKQGVLVAANPLADPRKPLRDRFVVWRWADCQFATERVIQTAAGGQTFHLRAVQLNAQGEVQQAVLLGAMLPTEQTAQAVYELMRRYMAHDDAGLPRKIRLAPAGRLSLFEALKHSFLTYIIQVNERGLPNWSWPAIALFYAALGAGIAVGLPFVLGKVAAELTAVDMKFPPDFVPRTGKRIPGVTVIPAQCSILPTWEKAFYTVALIAGIGVWFKIGLYVASLVG
ncbi:MAG: hypothetical protein C4K60_03415 [Ideonella sp. MAG2]|nr:MAG: hypothetical protein C4K60_03415 [Ideonella sp. MAG2]